MPISISYDKMSHVLIIYVIGSITLDEIRSAFNTMLSSSEFSTDVNTLWDLNEMDFSEATFELASQLITYRKSIDSLRKNAKAALVSDYELGGPLLKFYKIMSKDLGQQIGIFRYHRNAMEWLQNNG